MQQTRSHLQCSFCPGYSEFSFVRPSQSSQFVSTGEEFSFDCLELRYSHTFLYDHVSPPQYKTYFMFGACVPRGCNSDDVSAIINSVMPSSSQVNSTCRPLPSERSMPGGAVAAL